MADVGAQSLADARKRAYAMPLRKVDVSDPALFQSDTIWLIDRPRPRQHLSFGFGIHRCVGNRLAEMQLRVLWEEILKRWSHIEVVGEPKRVFSSFVRGYESLPV